MSEKNMKKIFKKVFRINWSLLCTPNGYV